MHTLLVDEIDECEMVGHMALKENGRGHLDWFDLCSSQNTPITNSKSKYGKW